jgi:hypothetical protein
MMVLVARHAVVPPLFFQSPLPLYTDAQLPASSIITTITTITTFSFPNNPKYQNPASTVDDEGTSPSPNLNPACNSQSTPQR